MKVKARELLRTFVIKSKSWQLLAALVDNYNRQKWYEEAVVLLEGFGEGEETPLDHAHALGRAYKNLREYKKAWTVYLDIVDAVPNDFRALKSLYWLSLGSDYTEALEWAEKIVQAYPNFVEQLHKLAEVHRRSREP